MALEELDLRCMTNPMCLLKARQALARLGQGQHLAVLLPSPVWADDLARIARRRGCRLVRSRAVDGGQLLELAVRGQPPARA